MAAVAQELWDAIIGFVSTQSDLKYCALVSRSFARPAQSHIFRSLTLRAELHVSCLQRVERLVAILDNSPHLATYVRELSVSGCTAAVLVPLSRIHWVHLQTINLNAIYKDPHALSLAGALVGTPSLREVRLSFMLLAHWTILDLHTLCTHLAPGVKSLGLNGFKTEGESLLSIPRNPPCDAPRPRIEHLSLHLCSEATMRLFDQPSPLNLTDLKSLKWLNNGDITTLHHFLRRYGAHVRLVQLESEDSSWNKLDFSTLPSLEDIETTFTSRLADSILPRLPPHNRVSRISFGDVIDNPWEKQPLNERVKRAASAFEKAALRYLPALSGVSIGVYTSKTQDEVAPNIRALFPRLCEKHLLSIDFF